VKKFKLDKLTLIVKHFNKFFKKKNKEKIKSRLVLNKVEQQSFIKKRKNLNIRFETLQITKVLKRNYIPYFLITSLIWLAIILFLIFWPIFKVKYIEIIKKDNITNMNISYKAVDDFRWESILKIDEKDIFNKFKSYQENIKEINLNIDFPNTIKIEAESYKEMFNIAINDKSYILVENGTLIPSKPSKNLQNLTIIKEIDKNKFIEYKKIFEPYYLFKINEIIKKLEENIINTKIKSLTYYEIERELHIETENNLLLIFSIDSSIDVNEQIKKLVIFNKDHLSLDKNTIVYIDLRVKNKIFYCPTESEYVCKKNIKSIYNK